MHTTSSQTIGPYLHIGMTWLVDETMAGASVGGELPHARGAVADPAGF